MSKNIIAIVILVVLGAVAFLVLGERPSEEKKKTKAAITPVPEGQLDGIRIVRREGKDDKAVTEKIVLKKKEGAWTMTEPVDYAVVEGPVNQMVDAISDLKVIDIISENKSNHGKFEVDEEKGVEVTALEGDKELAHLIVGKSRNGMTFVRVSGKDEVYRIQGYHSGTFNKSVKNLRDKSVLKRDLKNVTRVTFTNEKGELMLEREGEEEDVKFVPVGAKIENYNESKAKGVVRALVGLTARDFVDEALPVEKTGLGDDAARVVVEIQGSGAPDIVTAWVGNEAEKNQAYIKTSESDQLFLVSTSTVDRFKVGSDDFARTDKELEEEKERKKKAAEAAAARGNNQFPAVNTQHIPPDVLKQLQAQAATRGQ
ncbi:MAG: DUF4340 domain-containing protein [Proteobacteria bacterium]|nr:DUF4340 domain-containing protein [Pseudomonadota bacterium]